MLLAKELENVQLAERLDLDRKVLREFRGLGDREDGALVLGVLLLVEIVVQDLEAGKSVVGAADEDDEQVAQEGSVVRYARQVDEDLEDAFLEALVLLLQAGEETLDEALHRGYDVRLQGDYEELEEI